MSYLDEFSKLLKISPRAGRFVAIGLIVLQAAAVVVSWGHDINRLATIAFWIVGFSVLITVLMKLDLLATRLLGWVLILGIMFWSVAMVGQTITGSKISWIAPIQCLINPLSEDCRTLSDTNVISIDDAEVVDQVDLPPVLEVVDRVVVKFAGSINRINQIIPFSENLISEGYPIDMMPSPGQRGGIRTGQVEGLNEVRYYDDALRMSAINLAKSASTTSPAGQVIGVRDLSDSAQASAENREVLELLISN